MFRSKRSTLVKRLWKCRILDKNETTCTDEMVNRNKSSTSCPQPLLDMLKRLKEKHLEYLVQSVESRGGEDTGCVLLPNESLNLGQKGGVPPHVMFCQIWRWPELSSELLIKRLPRCDAEDLTSVCCNPYHWSLRVPESPPPCYKLESNSRVSFKDGDTEGSETLVSTETLGTHSRLQTGAGGSSSNSSRQYWCNLAYWEHRERVGRLFSVFESNVCVFQQLPRGDGMCLGVLQGATNQEAVRRTREKIGFGLILSRESDGLWMYNRSDYPVFVNSPTLENPTGHPLVVKKVQPGYSLNIFDFELSQLTRHMRDPQYLDGPYDPNSIRISFAKGWGPSYSRQFITSCPCWIEVHLAVNR